MTQGTLAFKSRGVRGTQYTATPLNVSALRLLGLLAIRFPSAFRMPSERAASQVTFPMPTGFFFASAPSPYAAEPDS